MRNTPITRPPENCWRPSSKAWTNSTLRISDLGDLPVPCSTGSLTMCTYSRRTAKAIVSNRAARLLFWLLLIHRFHQATSRCIGHFPLLHKQADSLRFDTIADLEFCWHIVLGDLQISWECIIETSSLGSRRVQLDLVLLTKLQRGGDGYDTTGGSLVHGGSSCWFSSRGIWLAH